jgi:hypothetical protein
MYTHTFALNGVNTKTITSHINIRYTSYTSGGRGYIYRILTNSAADATGSGSTLFFYEYLTDTLKFRCLNTSYIPVGTDIIFPSGTLVAGATSYNWLTISQSLISPYTCRVFLNGVFVGSNDFTTISYSLSTYFSFKYGGDTANNSSGGYADINRIVIDYENSDAYSKNVITNICNFLINNSSIISATSLSTNSTSTNILGGSVVATSFNATSDMRLKGNIQPLSKQWENIKSLIPSEYTFLQNNKYDCGFIAQQIYKVYPHMRPEIYSVNNDEDNPVDACGNPIYYTIDYGKITPYLCKGLQEVIVEHDNMKEEIIALKKELDELKAEIQGHRNPST